MHNLFRLAVTGAVLLLLAGAADSPSRAQGQLLEQYRALLGNSDHYNSKGVRLTAPWQIIRQDRANYHRFGIRDPGDGYDSFFASAANRAQMEQMIMRGHIDPAAAQRILNSQVWIRVEIYPNSVNVTVE